jgi:MFS family permease
MRSRPSPLRVLVDTQFGVFLAGNGLSLVGTWMQRIACSWLIWDWTHSAFWLGILSAGDLLPSVVVGPFAGVAADRWDRLRQNMLAQAVSAVLAALTAILLATGRLGLVGMVLLITAQGTLSAAIQPARLAMVQQMVAREDMGTAPGRAGGGGRDDPARGHRVDLRRECRGHLRLRADPGPPASRTACATSARPRFLR